MNWPSARSSRASCPLQHDEARAGQLRGRLEIHQAERLADLEMLLRPSSRLARRRSKRRHSTLPCSSAPTGTSASGMFGIAASASSSALPASARRASSAGDVGPSGRRPRPSAPARCASSFCAFAWPISFESALRRSCAACAAAIAARRRVVERDQRRRQRLQARAAQALVEGVGVFADGADVVHGCSFSDHPSRPEACRRSGQARRRARRSEIVWFWSRAAKARTAALQGAAGLT